MQDTEKIVYSINIEDIQNVANKELDRDLTEEELKRVEEKLGDYFDWYGTIAMCIEESVNPEKEEEEE